MPLYLSYTTEQRRSFPTSLRYRLFSSCTVVCILFVFQEVEGGVARIAKTLLDNVLRQFQEELNLSSLEKQVANVAATQ